MTNFTLSQNQPFENFWLKNGAKNESKRVFLGKSEVADG
jgi:hypothetical protein